MPKIKEQEHVRIKEKSTQEGKEQITKVADEKMVTTKAEAEKKYYSRISRTECQ